MTKLPPLDPAVAQTRLALRPTLVQARAATAESVLVLVALSGGADSLALAAATAFEAPRHNITAGAVIIDHGLQTGSAQVAERAAQQARELGLDPVVVHKISVPAGGGDGPEAAARAARYAALEQIRVELHADLVLTAHTRDDQVEQVLLALTRGSGSRAVAGIPPERGAIRRPLLAIDRHTTVRACEAQGLEIWADPHNSDPSFTRVRVRDRVLPILEQELGAGIRAGLARSADLAREDADALDLLAEGLTAELVESDVTGARLPVQSLEQIPAALRQRVIRRTAHLSFGNQISREHTLAAAALVTNWRGQGPIDLPGGQVSRAEGQLHFTVR